MLIGGIYVEIGLSIHIYELSMSKSYFFFFSEGEKCLNGMIESIQGKIVQIKDGCLTVIGVTTVGLMLKSHLTGFPRIRENGKYPGISLYTFPVGKCP